MMSAAFVVQAQESSTEFTVDFPVGSDRIDPAWGSNARTIARITDLLHAVKADPKLRISNVTVYGTVSPEGNADFNRRLADRRREALVELITSDYDLDRDALNLRNAFVQWDVLSKMMAVVDEPWAQQVADAIAENSDDASIIAAIKRINGSRVWQKLKKSYFTQMRTASAIVITVEQAPAFKPEVVEKNDTTHVYIEEAPRVYIEDAAGEEETVEDEGGKFYMDVRTNMLYDAAAVPNIGVEFYLGKNFSIGANWQYAWWSKNSSHRYWRLYGGDINARWWFGPQAQEKPLTGHHVGVYAQVATYDFEFGNRGWMGGKPGEDIFHRANWGVGAEYGFSLPVAPRINIDFTLGVGYFGGKVLDYRVIDGHYVWTGTKQRHWVGPTKAEISLVWLIGNGNVNVKKEKGNIDE